MIDWRTCRLSMLAAVFALACGGVDDGSGNEAVPDAAGGGGGGGELDAAGGAPNTPGAVDVECEEYAGTVEYSNGVTSRTTTYIATLPIPAGSPAIPSVAVVSCDLEYFQPPAEGLTCPDDATCTSEPRPSADCQVSDSYGLGDGEIVIWCGQKLETLYADEPERNTIYGQRYGSVRVLFR